VDLVAAGIRLGLNALRLRPLPTSIEVELLSEDEGPPAMDEEGRALLRLALFMNAMAKANAAELLGALAGDVRERVEALLQQTQRASSSERQAFLSQEFGPPPDVAPRLRDALLEAGPVLRREMLRQLPVYQRAWVSDLDAGDGPGTPKPPAPFLIALAERLVREATR
jgi:hypothetical protein